jgi:4-diphosphocytidyl-2-C-methyl-D-erythritol kinase
MASAFEAITSAQATRITVRCPAKINLHLRVGPARGDGFHPLLTWMCTVGLFDKLTMWLAPERHRAAEDLVRRLIELACDDPSLPVDERNLVVRMVQQWGETLVASRDRKGAGRAGTSGTPLPGSHGSLVPIAATLTKRIPAGAGLGGGSSDGAFALLAADQLWSGGRRDDGTPRPAEDLSAFAARFGSDIPFFLHGPSAVCSGRGEVVRETARPVAARWALLVLPELHMPTPEVYRRFDALGLGRDEHVEVEPDWPAWARLPAAELLARLVNDLEPAAFAIGPELGALRRSIEQSLARIVRMSGSGSSLFTLFDERSQAEEGKERIGRLNKAIQLEVAEIAPVAQVEEQ